jgi:transposase
VNWINGLDRQQSLLLPERLEDYVNSHNPVRVIDAFVENLDLAREGFHFPKEDPLGRGRPAYHPSALLKLYLYGYTHGVRSSRRLEAECRRNVEVLWLLEKRQPDFKTIADFRKDNRTAFKNLLRDFTALCQGLELFGGELLAVDGTKIKGVNHPGRNTSQRKLRRQLEMLEQQIEGYLRALDEADAAEQDAPPPSPSGLPSAAQLREKLAALRQTQTHCRQQLETLVATGQMQVSLTDPDSRAMSTGGVSVVGYNVQVAVDAKHKLLVSSAATNAVNDKGQLAPMALAAQAALEQARVQVAGKPSEATNCSTGAPPVTKVVADSGYYQSQDIKACQDAGLEPYVARCQNSPSEHQGFYGKADFRYDAAQDAYRCPGGATLKRRRIIERENKTEWEYAAPSACASCRCKHRCTAGGYRTLTRWEHEERLERMDERLAQAPAVLPQRKALVEHPFGTIKQRILTGGFLLRGLEKVGAEVSLAHWAYNFKRVVNIVGVAALLRALG